MQDEEDVLTDHRELHEEGECGLGCPWCSEEQCDHGGEG